MLSHVASAKNGINKITFLNVYKQGIGIYWRTNALI